MAELSAVGPSDKDAVIYRDAYQRREAEIRAVPDDELIPRNVEAQQALTTTLQGYPSILALVPTLRALFANYDSKPLENLADYAMAYLHCTTVDRASAPQVSPGGPLLDEGVKLCEVIGADLQAATARGTIHGAPLKESKGTSGYRNTADTLLLYAQVAHANWAKLEGKTHLSQAEVHHAEVLAARINAFLAERAREEGMKTDAELQSQRAFTLFFGAFKAVRRDVLYVLDREGRAEQIDEIMPHVHNGHASAKKRPEPPATGAQPSPAPTSVTTGAAPGLPLGPFPGKGAPVGMPGSDPFMPS